MQLKPDGVNIWYFNIFVQKMETNYPASTVLYEISVLTFDIRYIYYNVCKKMITGVLITIFNIKSIAKNFVTRKWFI